MARPIVFDLTYVVARLDAPTPTGIERVDAAYARHFVMRPESSPGVATAIHYGLRRPHRWTGAIARRLLADAATSWRVEGDSATDPVFQALAAWLATPAPDRLRATLPRPPRGPALAQAMGRLRWRLRDAPSAPVPDGAVYLNVAQYAFEYPRFFEWLDRRPDVRPVLFVHDLLPLDVPEFFREGYRAIFERRVTTIARFAKAAIVSTAAVGGRLAEELRRRGRPAIPILVAPLPPPTRPVDRSAAGPGSGMAGAAPYFVMVGTIEPRKNHLLPLHVWRDLARAGGKVPRLVLVGARGWDNEQVIDLIERSPLLAPCVAEVSGLRTSSLRRLVAGARALLMPSFEEGYGLPLAEALAEGTPAVASAIPVFANVSQGSALLLDPTDGPGWRGAIEALTPADSALRITLAANAARYVAPTWSAYFADVEDFLAQL